MTPPFCRVVISKNGVPRGTYGFYCKSVQTVGNDVMFRIYQHDGLSMVDPDLAQYTARCFSSVGYIDYSYNADNYKFEPT